MSRIVASPSREREGTSVPGSVMLVVIALMVVAAIALWGKGIGTVALGMANPLWFLGAIALGVLAVFCAFGFYTLEPNQARVLVLFGNYRGTVRTAGFHWGNPFYANGHSAGRANSAPAPRTMDLALHLPRRGNRMKISLRARNLNGDRLKVNDKRGNPIEIAAVVVWRVEDTAQAVFDVDDYESYVHIQIRVGRCATWPATTPTTTARTHETDAARRSRRGRPTRCARNCRQRLANAGRGHRGSAPDAPGLRAGDRAGDAAPPAGRGRHRGPPEDRARRGQHGRDRPPGSRRRWRRRARRGAARPMVSNLMVVLCSESQTQPVINTGTLYG